MRLSAHAATKAKPATLWPPILASRGPGAESALHAHHAMHLVLALDRELRVRSAATTAWKAAPGVLTGPDVKHAIDARGVTVLLVFIDPESHAGASLRGTLVPPVREVTQAERRQLTAEGELDPLRIMSREGVAWTGRLVEVLGGGSLTELRIHPRVRRVVRHLQTVSPTGDVSLEALAAVAGLSPGRLMHAFTASIGVPLRPYIAWLRLQRAAAAIVSGEPLAQAAAVAGFADAAHMTRGFRRMLGVTPSQLRASS